MPLFDYSLEELREYRPARAEPEDFDNFWAATLAVARRHDLAANFTPYDTRLTTVDTFDVSFAGYDGETVRGWLLLPAARTSRLPCVVEYIGYGGGRGLPIDHLLYSSAGYAHLVMDTRGQAGGDTGDAHHAPAGPHSPGFMTDGVLDPETYYYRRLMTDAVRAIGAARSHPAVDRDRVAVAGASQGGGLTIAVAGLVQDVALAMPDVPFLCHYGRSTQITDRGPYAEIAAFCADRPELVDRVFQTLAYFDGVNFAPRATCRALFSVGLMDPICPPSSVYAAYNNWGSADKDIRVWPYNEHDGGHHLQAGARLDLLHETFDIRRECCREEQ